MKRGRGDILLFVKVGRVGGMRGGREGGGSRGDEGGKGGNDRKQRGRGVQGAVRSAGRGDILLFFKVGKGEREEGKEGSKQGGKGRRFGVGRRRGGGRQAKVGNGREWREGRERWGNGGGA